MFPSGGGEDAFVDADHAFYRVHAASMSKRQFSTMLTDYGFTAHFSPAASDQTTVRIETFYTPANPVAAVLNRLVMRHRFRSVVDQLLGGLCTLAERRHTQPETRARHADAPGEGQVRQG